MARGQTATATKPELAIKISIGKFCDVIAIGSVYYFWTRQLQCCLCNLLNVKLQTGFANSASTAAAVTTTTAVPTTIADTQTSFKTAGAAMPYRDKQHAPLAEATHDYPYTARHNTCADLHSPTLTLHYVQLTCDDLHLHFTTQNLVSLTLTYTYSYTYIINILTLDLHLVTYTYSYTYTCTYTYTSTYTYTHTATPTLKEKTTYTYCVQLSFALSISFADSTR